MYNRIHCSRIVLYLRSLGIHADVSDSEVVYSYEDYIHQTDTELLQCIGSWHTPQKRAAEIGAVTSTPDSGASFSYRCTTSDAADCVWDPKTVNDVRSRASVRKNWRRSLASNLGRRRFLQPVSGACVEGFIQCQCFGAAVVFFCDSGAAYKCSNQFAQLLTYLGTVGELLYQSTFTESMAKLYVYDTLLKCGIIVSWRTREICTNLPWSWQSTSTMTPCWHGSLWLPRWLRRPKSKTRSLL